jgi:hypothetical protein
MKAEEFMRRNEQKLLVATVLLGVIALAATLLATAWTDEVFYVTPAANWAAGMGFTSNDWHSWGQVKTWGLSNPGLPFMIGLWFKVFGFGQLQAHVFIFIVYLAGLVGLIRWLGVRNRLTTPQMAAGLIVGLFVHSFNHDAIYHARHDCFWPLLFWWFLKFSYDERKTNLTRLFEAVLFGVACIFLGLHFGGFFAVGAATLFFYHRSKAFFFAGLGQAIGLLLGMLLLRLAYGEMGVWDDFIVHRSNNFGHAVKWVHWVISKDFWLVGPGLSLLLLIELLSGRGVRSEVSRVALIGLGLFVLIPPVIHVIGYYQAQYSWMVIAPVCLAVMPRLMHQPFGKGGWFNCLVIILAAGGITLRSYDVVQGVFEYQRRQELAKVTAGLIPSIEPRLISMSLYYELGRPGNLAYICYENTPPAPPAAAPHLRWMVMTATDAKIFKAKLGGAWEALYESPSGPLMMPHGNYVIFRKLP